MKRVNIKHPQGVFKVDSDKKNKQSIIAPGMHLELLVIFETDKPLTKDEFDEIIINSENDFKLVIPLKAYLPQPLIQFEPLINLGFVPVGTKKIDVINFLNEIRNEIQESEYINMAINEIDDSSPFIKTGKILFLSKIVKVDGLFDVPFLFTIFDFVTDSD